MLTFATIFIHLLASVSLTEASKSQKIDSKFSTETKTKTLQNLNMPPPLDIPILIMRRGSFLSISVLFISGAMPFSWEYESSTYFRA